MPASLWPAPSGRGHQSALERLRRDLSGHRFPNLYKALARGDWSDYQSCFIDPTEAWFSSYLYDEPVQLSVEQPPPWAMLQAPSAPETFAANTRFFVSPVHLQLSREGVYLIPPDELQLSEQDHIHLWEMAQALCEHAGWTTQQASANFINPVGFDAGINLSAPSPWSSSQLGLADYLPQGEHLRSWRSLWMDIQVSLHQHTVNKVREAKGLMPINAFWWWGGGKPCGSHWSGLHVTGEHPLTDRLLSFAHSSGLLNSADVNHAGRVFVAPVQTPLDWTEQAHALHVFDTQVIQPLLMGATPFDVVFVGQRGWSTSHIGSAVRWKVWRKQIDPVRLIEPSPEGPSEEDLLDAWEAGQRDQQAIFDDQPHSSFRNRS